MKKYFSTRLPIGLSERTCPQQQFAKPLQLEAVLAYLNDQKLKITKARKEIINLFLTNPQHTLTTHLIIYKLKKANPRLNIATVYNNLETLSSVGVLKLSINLAANKPAYELALDPAPHIHAFNLTNNCEEVLKVDCTLHTKLINYFAKQGLILEDYLIQAVFRPKPRVKEHLTAVVKK